LEETQPLNLKSSEIGNLWSIPSKF